MSCTGGPWTVQESASNVYRCMLGMVCKRLLKCVLPPSLPRSAINKYLQTFCQEAVMWKRLTHPNALPLLGITTAPPQLISKWMSGGDLPDYIKKNPDADRLGIVGVSSVMLIPRSLQALAI